MNTAPASTAASQQSLSDLENDVIALFVDLVRWFGAPKSLGAIYGLLFITVEPISFEQIATRLQMSNGSVSQGLKFLKALGAVKTTFLPGERRDFFVAEIQLRQLVSGFLRQRLERQLLNGEGRIGHLSGRSLVDKSEGGWVPERIHDRLELLKRWQTQVRTTLPLVLQMLER